MSDDIGCTTVRAWGFRDNPHPQGTANHERSPYKEALASSPVLRSEFARCAPSKMVRSVVGSQFFWARHKPYSSAAFFGVVALGVSAPFRQRLGLHRLAARVGLPAWAAVDAEAVRLRRVPVELLGGLRLAAFRATLRRICYRPRRTSARLAARGQTFGLAAILREFTFWFHLRALAAQLHGVTIT